MSAALELKLSLLRGETACPIDLGRLGRLASDRLQTVTRSVSSDRLAMAVLQLISSGRLSPGDRLPPERKISEAAALSRVCVRSALERLKSEGYIASVQGSGTRVAAPEDGGKLCELIRAGQENQDDLAAFVTFLDRCTVERLVRSAPDGRLAGLADRVAASRPPDQPLCAKAEIERRIVLAEACGSPVYGLVARHLERGIHTLFAHLPPVPPRDGSPWVDAMEALADGLRRRDGPCAQAALRHDAALLHGAVAGRRARPEKPEEGELLRDLAVSDAEQLKSRISREITALIFVEGQDQGDRLPSERRLADLFGVSRASVREALASLKEDGTVVAEQRCGTRVRVHSSAPPANADPDHFWAMSRLHGHLEVRAAGRAAVQGSERDLADLRNILTEMKRAHLNHRRRCDLDLRLHLTIARAAGNAVHLYVMEVLRQFVPSYFDHALNAFTPGEGRDAMVLQHHTAIISAILGRDAAAARWAMAAHCRAFWHLCRAPDGDGRPATAGD